MTIGENDRTEKLIDISLIHLMVGDLKARTLKYFEVSTYTVECESLAK